MSYKTNPIFNRIKINKGWKNPYLPTKTLNYSRDISLWFKVYLLLKVFLNLKKIQLVSFEIRFDQQNKKILYLRINKKGDRKKKRRKKKLALNKVLKKIQTPMLKNKNAGSIFFLYKELLQLKKLTFWNKNGIQKRILSKFWLTKPKISTWLNTLEKILVVRQKTKKKFPYAKTDKKFLPTQHLKLNFYTNQQKQLLAQIAKIKKKNRILSIRFFALLQKKNQTILEKSTQNLKKQILNNKIQIQKIRSIYNFLFSSLQTISLKKSARLWKKKIILDRMQKQKLNCFWKACKKQFSSLRRIRFLKKELPFLLLKLNKKSAQSISKSNCNILKKNAVLKKVLHLNFLIGQMSGNAFLIRNYLLFTRFNFISKLNSKRKNKQKILRRFSFKSLQVHSFLKKNLGKNKKKSLQKKQLAAKLYYDIALWTVLRKKKKKKSKISSQNLLEEN